MRTIKQYYVCPVIDDGITVNETYFLLPPGLPTVPDDWEDMMEILYISSTQAQLTANKYKNEIALLLEKIYRERYHVSILGFNINSAVDTLNSIIMSSANNFGAKLRLLADNFESITEYKKSTKRSIATDITHERDDDARIDTTAQDGLITETDSAAIDNQLNKVNRTPKAGNNPNLLEDTYLSESERITNEQGERNRINDSEQSSTTTIGPMHSLMRNLGVIDDNYELYHEFHDIESINELMNSMTDILDEWLRYLDRVAFTY